ncbi:MAG: ABC transporter permease [Desulfovibrio sp.]|jgi:D-methionine transport system permease protein|nr:ABC transporter permease [Desulfovibrio sp.]MDR3362868.1 ABC transporter permease [Desulfovibrio sp.]
MIGELFRATLETLYMVSLSTFFSLVLGFGLAVVLIMTAPGGLRPNPGLYRALDATVNLLRSFPFMILMIALIPVTSFIVGMAIGSTAAIVPLTVAATPFMARLVEGSFLEVDPDVVEAARSFGASDSQIIFRVLLTEALPSIVLNTAVLAIALLGYSAMAGAIGGGGLGAFAYNYGYLRFRTEMMFYAVVLLIVIVQAIQTGGNILYRRLR